MWDLQALFRRHSRELDRFLRRRGHNPETAADLTQDTFVRVLTAAPAAQASNPRAYLYQIARNLSVDLHRRERLVDYADLTDDEFLQIADARPGAETVVYDRQRLAIVDAALAQLPEDARRAFEMHRLGEKTIQEVAAELEISTARTWRLIRQAYHHLRARLNEDAI
ncbi:MAG: RNA polymerase sigma factor [Pseudomonadota bacterium]